MPNSVLLKPPFTLQMDLIPTAKLEQEKSLLTRFHTCSTEKEVSTSCLSNSICYLPRDFKKKKTFCKADESNKIE